jgi:hypothetical protein
VVSLLPTTGSGQSQTFAATFSDSGGAAAITLAYMQVGSVFSSSGAGSCYVEFNASSDTYRLLNDAGTAWSAPLSVGSGSASNSQCTLHGAGASATPSGNNLTVDFPLTFAAGYAGSKQVYLYVDDASGLGSGWQQLGSFTVTNGAPPAVVSLLPTTGSGQGQTFAATFSDSGGAAAITLAYMQVGSVFSSSGAGSCYVEFNASSDTYRLLNDAGTAWSAPLSVGSGSASNSQCTLNGAGAGATPSGNNLTVDFPLTFAAGYAGSKQVYLYVDDASGLGSGWQQLGSFTVP